MDITPHQVSAVYEMLRSFRPFKGWKLPPADEVEFSTKHWKGFEGQYDRYPKTNNHIIQISTAHVGQFDTLLEAVAHEMLHLKQAIHKTETRGQHNEEFKRLAGTVCREFMWDVKRFIR